jgi:hypothetical protein
MRRDRSACTLTACGGLQPSRCCAFLRHCCRRQQRWHSLGRKNCCLSAAALTAHMPAWVHCPALPRMPVPCCVSRVVHIARAFAQSPTVLSRRISRRARALGWSSFPLTGSSWRRPSPRACSAAPLPAGPLRPSPFRSRQSGCTTYGERNVLFLPMLLASLSGRVSAIGACGGVDRRSRSGPRSATPPYCGRNSYFAGRLFRLCGERKD